MSMFAATKLLKRNAVYRVFLSNSTVKCTETKSVSSASAVNEQSSAKNVKPLRDMPGPSVLENLARLARSGFRYHHYFMKEMFERYGPFFRHTLPGTNIVYISDPTDIEYVFRSEEADIPSRGDLLLVDYDLSLGLDPGITGDEVESWYRHRKLLAPKLLRLGALKPYFNAILDVTEDTIANFQNGLNDDLQDHLARWTAETIGVILFGVRIGTNHKTPNQRAAEFVDAIHGYFDKEAKLFLGVPFYKYFKTPTLSQAFGYLDTQREMSRYFAEKARNEKTELAKACIVNKIEKEDNTSEAELIQICNNLFVAGVHTTACSFLQLFHVLAKHPEVQKKAYEEIQKVLGDNKPKYDDLNKLPYLKAMIKEGFRYNTAPLVNMRITKQPLTIRGYHIPAGTFIMLSKVASSGMQKQKYGNPEKFSPERWLRSTGARSSIHPFSDLQFGFGIRLCIGKRLVELETALFMLRLLQKYEIMDNNLAEDKIDWVFNMLVTPKKPYPLRLKQRN